MKCLTSIGLYLLLLYGIQLKATTLKQLFEEKRHLRLEIKKLNERVQSMHSQWDLSDDDQALDNFYVLYDQLSDRLGLVNLQLKQKCGKNIIFLLRNKEIGT